MTYRDFDWEQAKSQHSQETFDFLKLNHDSPMSEEAFVKIWSDLPRTRPHASKSRSPSAARSTYRHLKERFGFFGGVIA